MRSPAEPAAGAYRQVARADAGLFTQAVNYPIAARLCVLAHRLRIRPTVLTLANLLLGTAASVGLLVFAPVVAGGGTPALLFGVGAWLVWQVAYCCDCADGQLARVTGTATAAGGRLDVLCDIAVQILLVTATAVVAAAAQPGVPVWLIAAFAATWMVNLVTSVMTRAGTNTSLMGSAAWPVRVVKLIRDYGFMLTLIGGVIAVAPAVLVWVMAGFTVVNGGFLAASIVQSARPAASCGGAAVTGEAS